MIIMSPLRILCFGDSLTWGFSHGGHTQHPYAGALKSSLKAYLPDQNITTDNKGLNGDLVVSPPGGFLPRMDIIYEEIKNPYTWAVVLGGTNDLGWGHEADEMYESIQKVWDIPLAHGTKVLALTVPECGVESMCTSELTARRDAYNAYILGHEQVNLYTYDFHAAMPWTDMPESQRKELWDDGVHFTPQGYDLMGSLIADRIVELISEIEQKESSASKEMAQKPMKGKFRNVKEKVEEVAGKALRSGRIIVKEDEAYAA